MKKKIRWTKEEIYGDVEHVVHSSGIGWTETPYGEKMSRERSKRNEQVTEAAIQNSLKRKKKISNRSFLLVPHNKTHMTNPIVLKVSNTTGKRILDVDIISIENRKGVSIDAVGFDKFQDALSKLKEGAFTLMIEAGEGKYSAKQFEYCNPTFYYEESGQKFAQPIMLLDDPYSNLRIKISTTPIDFSKEGKLMVYKIIKSASFIVYLHPVKSK